GYGAATAAPSATPPMMIRGLHPPQPPQRLHRTLVRMPDAAALNAAVLLGAGAARNSVTASAARAPTITNAIKGLNLRMVYSPFDSTPLTWSTCSPGDAFMRPRNSGPR